MIETKPMASSIKLKYLVGVDSQGNDVYKTKTINNVSSSATDETIYGLKALLEAVQDLNVSEFALIKNNLIIEK